MSVFLLNHSQLSLAPRAKHRVSRRLSKAIPQTLTSALLMPLGGPRPNDPLRYQGRLTADAGSLGQLTSGRGRAF